MHHLLLTCRHWIKVWLGLGNKHMVTITVVMKILIIDNIKKHLWSPRADWAPWPPQPHFPLKRAQYFWTFVRFIHVSITNIDCHSKMPKGDLSGQDNASCICIFSKNHFGVVVLAFRDATKISHRHQSNWKKWRMCYIWFCQCCVNAS